MTTHPPTDEQVHIRDLFTSTPCPIMVNASAGTGKTTMFEMLEAVAPKSRKIIYLVFNKRNKTEARGKMSPATDVQNFNGLGHGIWSEVIGSRLSLVERKTNNIVTEIIKSSRKHLQRDLWNRYYNTVAGVKIAKDIGYAPIDVDYPEAEPSPLATEEQLISMMEEEPDDLTLALIDKALIASISAAYLGTIDYGDQIYMPTLFNAPFPRYDDVWVDEYQDLNPVNHAMVDRLLAHGARLIGVGDDAQSIYVFRGAVPGSMAKAQVRYSMTLTTLSISFRCPEAVVKAAQWRVPHFRWIKPGGHVERLDKLDPSHIPDNAAIICRNNAPLFKLGMQLLGSGRAISIAGSDIGPRLIGIMRKLGDEEDPRPKVLAAIEDWRQERLSKESTTANDLADCMTIFANYGTNLAQAITYAEDLFAEQGPLRLLTGHKSKGLEYDNVYMLDPFLIRKDDQDQNLRYVMQTRSASHLYEVDSDQIKW